MDIIAACEDLAANVAAFDLIDDGSHISDSERSMWQALFDLSSDEAVKAIRDWRADFTRLTISQGAWSLVKETKVSEGFNKESYEYSLSLAQRDPQRLHTSHNKALVRDEEATYLVKLECGSLPSMGPVELISCLPKKPTFLTGLDEDGNTTEFCLLSGCGKAEFLSALSKAHPSHKPTLIRVSIASKNLSPTSLYPTLGVDTTLPQFRPGNSQLHSHLSSSPSFVRPLQDEYPVWYFFYGSLADASTLSRIAGEAIESIKYKRARVQRGRLSMLGEKYFALVDAHEHSTVDGWAYRVKNQNEEDSLRVYETGKYEVVRCTMAFGDGNGDSIHGLTFRLA